MASTFGWSYISVGWSPRRFLRWSGLMSVTIVDELVWGVVMAFESVALLSMLAFFFFFYGCTIWSQHTIHVSTFISYYFQFFVIEILALALFEHILAPFFFCMYKKEEYKRKWRLKLSRPDPRNLILVSFPSYVNVGCSILWLTCEQWIFGVNGYDIKKNDIVFGTSIVDLGKRERKFFKNNNVISLNCCIF